MPKDAWKKDLLLAPIRICEHELEASFIYEDTPDQSTSTQAVKEDMESERPIGPFGMWGCRFWKDRGCH